MDIYSIYKFVNLVNGKVYIGKTTNKNPRNRFTRHIRDSVNGSDALLHRALRKYGVEHFSFEVIFNIFANFEELNFYEKLFISEYDCCVLDGAHKGYNMTRGGDGISPDLCSKIQLEKVKNGTHNWLSKHNSEILSAQNRQRVIDGTNPFAGQKGSELAKRRISIFNPFAGALGKSMHEKQLKEGKHQSQREHVCPHCGKIGKGAAMFYWHFSGCKSLK